MRDIPLREMWPSSDTRVEVVAVARSANDRLVSEGGSVSAFPFCPALAEQRTGDPLKIEAGHRELAEAAARIRRSTT